MTRVIRKATVEDIINDIRRRLRVLETSSRTATLAQTIVGVLDTWDEGVALPQRPNLNFVGAGVTAQDNPGTQSTDVIIPGVSTSAPSVQLMQRSGTALNSASSPAWVWTPIPAFKRGIVVRFEITSTLSNWAFQVRGGPGGSGSKYFEADSINFTDYAISWPWWYHNDESTPQSTMYVGVSNPSSVPSSVFTLSSYTAEVFAP